MSIKYLSVQEVLAIFELPSDNNSAASNNSNAADDDYVENFSLGENIPSDDEKINEIQLSSTSHFPVKTKGGLYRK
ncbi:hypothetical protein TNIN_238711 [Trichonephila inaurata madagascariensis]|uniref:Uncharacterized protein n=1 Tax=Trichonephila inaurata madagascariensis TaxID=2747483 RepID=A0A8X6WW16_9ARAC|nr:hypothetical protein TNIN_238711 [Trichonephila inaurata madagascariensis]